MEDELLPASRQEYLVSMVPNRRAPSVQIDHHGISGGCIRANNKGVVSHP